MQVQGRLIRPRSKGGEWIAEIGLLSVGTTGRSAKEACACAARAIETLVLKEGFRASYHLMNETEFTVVSKDRATFLSFILRRTRETYGLSVREIAERLGISPNGYAQYEQGTRAPSVEKFEEFLRAMDPALEPVLNVSAKRVMETITRNRK